MGDWAKWEFKRDELPENCIMFAGSTPQWQIDKILNQFDEIVFTKHDNYNPYIVKKGDSEFLILFQVYGAAMVADLITILKDGKVNNIYFIGAAYGLLATSLIGDYVIPIKTQCLDGVTGVIGNIDYVEPDNKLCNELKELLKAEDNCRIGHSVSVPATFWHPDHNKIDSDVIALEMEFSSLCYFSMRTGIKSAGVLVISDTKNKDLLMDQTLRYENIYKVFLMLIEKLLIRRLVSNV